MDCPLRVKARASAVAQRREGSHGVTVSPLGRAEEADLTRENGALSSAVRQLSPSSNSVTAARTPRQESRPTSGRLVEARGRGPVESLARRMLVGACRPAQAEGRRLKRESAR